MKTKQFYEITVNGISRAMQNAYTAANDLQAMNVKISKRTLHRMKVHEARKCVDAKDTSKKIQITRVS